jgi:hypothetical protein
VLSFRESYQQMIQERDWIDAIHGPAYVGETMLKLILLATLCTFGYRLIKSLTSSSKHISSGTSRWRRPAAQVEDADFVEVEEDKATS